MIYGYFGFAGFGISSPDGAAGLIDYAGGAYTYYTDFISVAMFAATAATIVSGAVAERIKITFFLVFSTLYTQHMSELAPGNGGQGGLIKWVFMILLVQL